MRRMTVCVGKAQSQPLPVNAGAPQGSVLGSFLFNAGTDDLDDDDGVDYGPSQEPSTETLPIYPVATSSPPRQDQVPFLFHTASPIVGPPRDFEILPKVVNVPPHLCHQPKWVDRDIYIVNYIDNAMILEKCNVHGEPLLEVNSGKIEIARANKSEKMFARIASRAKSRGMLSLIHI